MGKMILMNFDKVTKGASAPYSFEASFYAHHDTPARADRGEDPE
jgi:hypothetical protein